MSATAVRPRYLVHVTPPHPPLCRTLWGNDLTGSVPPQLGLLTNLKYL